MPVVGNPIIYLFCVTEYRQNILNMWRLCTQGKSKLVETNSLQPEFFFPGNKEVHTDSEKFGFLYRFFLDVSMR